MLQDTFVTFFQISADTPQTPVFFMMREDLRAPSSPVRTFFAFFFTKGDPTGGGEDGNTVQNLYYIKFYGNATLDWGNLKEDGTGAWKKAHFNNQFPGLFSACKA